MQLKRYRSLCINSDIFDILLNGKKKSKEVSVSGTLHLKKVLYKNLQVFPKFCTKKITEIINQKLRLVTWRKRE